MGGYSRRRRNKQKLLATGVAALALGLLGGLFHYLGEQQTENERLLLQAERAILTGDYTPMRDSVELLGQMLAADDRAAADLRALDARAELAVSLLYTGSLRQRERARSLLEDAKSDSASSPQVLITEAFLEATIGDPSIASSILESDELTARYPEWARVSNAAAALRRGDAVDAVTLATNGQSGLAKVWAVRTVWQQGDAETIELLAKRVLDVKPGNVYVEFLKTLDFPCKGLDVSTGVL